ncbi:MAG TPA: CYTH and CHAD domain-containing protein [Motilibacteraceae bacterium]|nr:CYTH and CHAD domain-containing protein [Motilibacteraceae bacterium]
MTSVDEPGGRGTPGGRSALREHLEVERTYVLPPGEPFPDLSGTEGVGGVGAERVLRLDAVYWDTSDLRLAARGVRLRRRTGGTDAGWHVKMPTADGVVEVHAPVGRTEVVPRELAALVRAVTRGAPLASVARLRTRRRELDLLDTHGAVVAVVADDDVSGRTLPAAPDGGQRLLRWRELEVELSDGSSEHGGELLDAVESRLRAAGASPSDSPSKVGKTLADDVPPVWPSSPVVSSARSRAGDVLTAYVRTQVDAIVSLDPLVRRDAEDALHRMRVATRRLRSALRSYSALLDRSVTDPLADRLRELAAVLGGARDGEVLRARILTALSDVPSEMVVGPVAERIGRSLGDDLSRAQGDVLTALDSADHAELLDRLVELASSLPWADPRAARRRAGKVLPPAVERAHRRVRRDLKAAGGSGVREDRDLALHEARKAAKRVRYAAEVLVPAQGKSAERVARRAEKVQAVLGEHQDAVVARGVLLQLGAAAHEAGESAFTYGVLAQRELERAELAEGEVAAAARRLARAVERL